MHQIDWPVLLELIKSGSLWNISVGNPKEVLSQHFGEPTDFEEFKNGLTYIYYSYIRFTIDQSLVKGITLLDKALVDIEIDDELNLDFKFSFSIPLHQLICLLFSIKVNWAIDFEWSNCDFLILGMENNCRIYYDLYKGSILKIELYIP